MSDLKITSEKDFFRDYERAKHMIDKGLKKYFLLYDNEAFRGLDGMPNLTLSEIEECYGEEFIAFLQFGINYNLPGEDSSERISTLRFRRLRENDKKRMRGMYRFFPNDCWVCEWGDATGFQLILPFTQRSGENIKFLAESSMYRNDKKRVKTLEDRTLPQQLACELLARAPWYAECTYAVVSYNNVDVAIPLDKTAGKKTFKNRERDEYGVKRRLIHHVSEHARKSLVNQGNVSAHLRGCSDLTINGVNVTLAGSWEWGNEILKKTNKTTR